MPECERCGESFSPYRSNQRFCSKNCRINANARRNYQRDYHTAWRRKNRDHVNARQRKVDEDNPIQRILRQTKSRAKKFGIIFDLSEDDIVIPDVCPVFKTSFVRGTRMAASLDKIDPTKGYVKGNVQVISRLANTMKSDASQQELREFADWVNRLTL